MASIAKMESPLLSWSPILTNILDIVPGIGLNALFISPYFLFNYFR
jgi:hypothetical protein